ncbi:glycoside hydrolase family 30 protein [Dyella nitratireducens]|uniref:Glucosylceramidase n=1 Tax=Dyella nitratireducens TaxID=1849580 RepID=A0ABQ1FTR6_9GAMM|nr:glycoside hydrolase family 30 beta sandwich domain-containing protein [Dyella nitratireducens]GGA29391.1 glucosylceramidase [Dyella nitratireducens]GLQ43146.1 glucosylceramidase [Dyella nitratireducens]
MNERRSDSPRTAIVFIALLILLALAALYAPRFTYPAAKPKAAPSTRSTLPTVQLWLSTANRRLTLQQQPDIAMSARGSSPADVVIDLQKRFQTMVGFGAAMTDSSAWLLKNKLNFLQRRALLHELYGPPPNLGLNMMRLTIGASDFSLKPYTLDDVPFGQVDPQLQHFNVTPTVHDVIPMVREVLSIDPGLHIVASPWSAPAWMKTSENLIGGELLPQYESAYADYLVKYLDAYLGYGIPIFAVTLQNEPGFVPVTYPGMEVPEDTRARIIAQYLGPKLASRTQKTQILEWDHNWNQPEQPLALLANPDAARYVDGVAWHCYEGSQYAQGRVHRAYPQKDTYITECSGGDWASAANGELLWFTRELLVTGTRQWARGVIYWNLVLDEQHGPHFGGCAACKGVVTIDSHTGAVTRNDEYYAFAHFSRFVLPGAVRVESTKTDDKGLANVAFQNASDGSIVLVMVNSNVEARSVSIAQDQTRFDYTMPPESVATFVWNPGEANAWVQRVLGWFRRAR